MKFEILKIVAISFLFIVQISRLAIRAINDEFDTYSWIMLFPSLFLGWLAYDRIKALIIKKAAN